MYLTELNKVVDGIIYKDTMINEIKTNSKEICQLIVSF